MKKFLYSTLVSFLFFSLSYGQGLKISNSKTDAKTEKLSVANEIANEQNNPFMFTLPKDITDKKELVEKRDMTSKHFQNEDGSLTAILAAGPIHYNDNGKWKDINHQITANSNSVYSYANTTNLLESYFGAYSNIGVKNKTAQGEVKEFLNLKMYWEVAGQTQSVTNAANVPVSVSGDKAYYNNLFGNISAEFAIESGRRKLNYIIPNIQALNTIPANADYLVFKEEIEIPQGWSYALDAKKGVLLKDASGTAIYAYENPVSTDANNDLDRNVNTIMEASLSGNTLTILTKVKTAWLLDNNRQFPVKVDPTVNVSPTNATNWTRSVYDDGYNQAGLYFGLDIDGYWLRGFAKFNSASIPTTGVTVNSVTGYINVINAYVAWNGPWQFGNAADPTTTSGSTLYNSANLGYSTISTFNSTGSKNSVFFNPSGNTFIANELTLGRINLSIIPAGSFSYGQYYQLRDHTHLNRPYLSINYTLPTPSVPSCATLIAPTNGSTEAIAPPSWSAVAGATSYDVYFGTSSTPPLVSTSQTITTYTPTVCLLPGTVYYWKVVPKNANGSATGCATWSFTSATKLAVYRNDWESSSLGTFPTSGNAVDGWIANDNSGIYFSPYYYYNLWTVGNGPNAITGNSIGVSGLRGSALAGDYFDYWTDLGTMYRWVHRGIDLTGLRDVELSFKWKGEGEAGQDYGQVATSINSGTNWLTDDQGGLYNNGEYYGSYSTVRSQSITLPSSRNNQSNFRLAFKWNDLSGNGYGGNNSFIIDDIVIKACPYEGVIASNKTSTGVFEWFPGAAATNANLSITGSHTCAQYAWEQSTDGGGNWAVIVGATNAAYTTPSALTVSTWFRAKVYYGTACSGVYQDQVYKITKDGPPSCATLLTPTNNATGVNISATNLTWQSVSGATSYDVYFGTSVSPSLVTNTTSTSYSLPTLSSNTTYYWQIIPKNASGSATGCAVWKFATINKAPYLVNFGGSEQLAFNNSLIKTTEPVFRVTHSSGFDDLQLQINKDVTFVQPNVYDNVFTGSFTGENNFNTTIVQAPLNSSLFPQPFNTNVLTTGASAPTTAWFAPNSNAAIAWSATGGNPTGRIGYSSAWNNFWGNFIRLPEVNCTGKDTVTLTFDVWNSYFASHPNDRARIYILADGAYKRPITALTINGQDKLANYGINGFGFNFDEARTAAQVEVTFDLTGIIDKSNILFYIEPDCGYNNSDVFSVYLDNIAVNAGGSALVENETYYVRVKGANTAWSLDTFSFTYASASDLKWFQTAKPQFGTDKLEDLAIFEADDRVSLIDGAPIAGMLSNPSFETGTSWTVIQSFPSGVYEAVQSNGNGVGSMPTNGSQTRMLRPKDPGNLGYFNGDYVGITQAIDLTGVDEITMDIAAWHFTPLFVTAYTGSLMQLRVIIGAAGTGGDNSGTVLGTFNNPTASLGVQSWTNTTFDVSAYSGNYVLKIVSFVQIATSSTNDEARFYIDNIRTGTGSTNTGKLTSTPINLASFQDGETWNQLVWDQKRNNGTLNFSIEKFDGSSWSAISGLTNISELTDGAHSYDISAAGSESVIRVVGDFVRNGPPELYSFGISTKPATPLPVTWLNISTLCLDKGIEINWSTATEINNDYFEVFASADGVNFENVGKVKGAGNSANINNYSLLLEKQGKYKYFKVKQTDFNGEFEFSKIVTSNCSNDVVAIEIYPNPFDGNIFYINYSGQENDLSVKIYDLSGKLIEMPKTVKTDRNITVTLNTKLAGGTYFVEIYNQQGFLTMKKLMTK